MKKAVPVVSPKKSIIRTACRPLISGLVGGSALLKRFSGRDLADYNPCVIETRSPSLKTEEIQLKIAEEILVTGKITVNDISIGRISLLFQIRFSLRRNAEKKYLFDLYRLFPSSRFALKAPAYVSSAKETAV